MTTQPMRRTAGVLAAVVPAGVGALVPVGERLPYTLRDWAYSKLSEEPLLEKHAGVRANLLRIAVEPTTARGSNPGGAR